MEDLDATALQPLRPTLLIVDDDVGFVHSAAHIARGEGFDITIAGDLQQAIKRVREAVFDLVLIDLKLPDGDGIDLLDQLDLTGRTRAVLITGHPTVESAIKAVRSPVLDYVLKPLQTTHYRALLADAHKRCHQSAPQQENDWHGMVGASAALVRVGEETKRVAPTDASVLIHGESGVGKELVARAVHERSARPGAFVALNCGAVPAELLASQLFGHEKGSFTGANARHIGYFEQAQEGTLFLDEITEMPASLQMHLLRALENRCIRRVGGLEDIAVQVRIVAATNRRPANAIREGKLRADLFYRLCEFPIWVPPLRNRIEDVEPLADAFLARLNEHYGTRKGFAPGIGELLRRYHWPGNIRELRNAIQRAYILAVDDVVRVEIEEGREPRPPLSETVNSITFAVGTSYEEIERRMLFKTLAHFKDDKVRTAQALGVSVKTIYNRLARYQPDGYLPRDMPEIAETNEEYGASL